MVEGNQSATRNDPQGSIIPATRAPYSQETKCWQKGVRYIAKVGKVNYKTKRRTSSPSQNHSVAVAMMAGRAREGPMCCRRANLTGRPASRGATVSYPSHRHRPTSPTLPSRCKGGTRILST
eukprot:scaffold408_cov347-Pavlova_lutheri.AAC.6